MLGRRDAEKIQLNFGVPFKEAAMRRAHVRGACGEI